MRRRSSGTAASARARLRAWWLRRQRLTPGTSPRTVEACVRHIGWLPTAGGPGVYLSVRARMPRTSRDAVDRAAIDGTPLVEVPGPHARPPVLVPREDMALALCLHRASFVRHITPYLRSGRIDATTFRGIGAAVCRALEEGPMTSADIRRAITHTEAGALLPGALLDLGLRGVIRRFPADTRLDSPKYLYELLHPDDQPDLDAAGDPAAVAVQATERFLRWHGPATLDELSAWSELTKKTARAALETLGAEAEAIPGWSDAAWLLPADARAWRAFDGASDGRVALLPYRDPFIAPRRDAGVLTEHPSGPVLDRGSKPSTIADAGVLHHHVIVCGGEVTGVWEYDPKARAVVTRVWRADRKLREQVATAAEDTARFIREQLGDAKLSAVDPPAARARRLAFCRGEA